jgi:hypothetical protein
MVRTFTVVGAANLLTRFCHYANQWGAIFEIVANSEHASDGPTDTTASDLVKARFGLLGSSHCLTILVT